MNQEQVSSNEHHPAPEQAEIPAANMPIGELRLEKIEAYQREALTTLPLEQANLAAATGGLMFVGMKLETAIMTALAARDTSYDKVQPVLSGVNTLIQCARQHERYVRLGQELRRERSQEKKS